MLLPNSYTVQLPEHKNWVESTLIEYEKFGFIQKVNWVPHCILPLQVKAGKDKNSLIYDMSPLNLYVEKSSFKLESWEEMFNFSLGATHGIKFDLKKYYHQIKIHDSEIKYYGFVYKMSNAPGPEYFVWRTMPYGYTRAPYIARELMKPLISRWRKLGVKIVVFYDDGMAVGDCPILLLRSSLQIHCDLLRAGLVPGFDKCIWMPSTQIPWTGLVFDFLKKGISVKERRIQEALEGITLLKAKWPRVIYREISSTVGRIIVETGFGRSGDDKN